MNNEFNFNKDGGVNVGKYRGIVDDITESQIIVNEQDSDICDIMSTPAGVKMLEFVHAVRSTWWYKLFSKIDGRFKEKIAL